jgi:hypothetical protein
MTQRFAFVPSNVAAPSFQATLDKDLYAVSVTWNVSSQRYFVNVYSAGAALVMSVPLTVSPKGVELAALDWDANQRVVVAQLKDPWWRDAGQIVRYTIEDCEPDTFNGTFDCLTITPNSFSFPMIANPGQAKVLGSVNRYLNMLAPWFKTSTMIYRGNAFEVRP